MGFRRFSNSLVTRLIGLSIVTVVLGTGLRLIMVPKVFRGSLQEVVTGQQATLANYVAEDIDGKVRARRALLERLALDLPPDLLARPQALQAWLGERQLLAPLFSRGLLLVRSDGQGLLAGFPLPPAREANDFRARDWYQQMLRQPGFVIGRPGRDTPASGGELMMAVPVLDARGGLLAVLAGRTELDAPGFLDLIQRDGARGAGFLLVSPADRLFVAASVPSMRLQPTPAPGINPLHDRAMAGWRGTGVTTNAQGVEEIVAVTSVVSAGWFVVARIPAEEAFRSIEAAQGLAMRFSTAVAAVVVLILMLLLRHQFRPLLDSARRMRRMADRLEPLAPLPVLRRDEVGEMVEGFNYLLGKLQESERRMDHLAHHDALTGLPNRLCLMERLAQALSLAQRQQRRVGLLFLDLDGFKPVNDQHGHEMGDRLLCLVAQRLRSGVRLSDTVARIGGDEFVLVMCDVPGHEVAAELAAKLIEQLSEPYWLDGLEIRVSASAGMALYPDDAHDQDQLLACADSAMYEAKRAGSRQIRFAAPLPPP